MREFLALTGIDPAFATALRRGEEAEAKLAEIPDTPELEAADAAILPPQNSNVEDKAYREFRRNLIGWWNFTVAASSHISLTRAPSSYGHIALPLGRKHGGMKQQRQHWCGV
jgi:hypothetical protein